MSPTLFILLNTNCKPWYNVATLNVNPKLFVIPCKFFGRILIYSVAITVTYQVLFHPKFQSFMSISHHKLLTRVLANAWTHPSSMTIFVHLFNRSVIQKVTTVTLNAICTLNIMFSVWFSCTTFQRHGLIVLPLISMELASDFSPLWSAWRRTLPPLPNPLKRQWSGRFLGMVGWGPRVCKSKRSPVNILRFSFTKLGYILKNDR